MCGILGVVATSPVNQLLYDGLQVLQHRGQDAAGIATSEGGRFHMHKGSGLVRDVFRTRNMRNLEGNWGIGHVRYPTAGSAYNAAEAQPFYVNSPFGLLLAHNGNLTNSEALKREMFLSDLRHINTSSSLKRARNRDDLPRFLARFKELLNVNTINEIANFNAQLARERETIKERIAHINKSLGEIDYNPGRYIVLESQPSPDAEIRDFQQELRACTEGALSGAGEGDDEQYSEDRFLRVKGIIDRFRGREGLSDQDRRWTAKVTDVRNWFLFAASERWREDDSEHEHYSDSGGKSGGQKEKLAYTILAASLAYQFGLEWGAVRSRSFRFVVIDEAFGRGSDESAQYGLRLFEQLNLQLLIVTPLQKIHIIEPFVAGVGFVHNEDGRNSVLRNLSIEEYRAEKQRLQA